MDGMIYWLIGYVIFLNIYLHWAMGKDKEMAKKNMPRIPERHFMIFSILGGALGCYLGMKQHRHKTQHRKFSVGLPIIIAVQAILLVALVGVLG